MSRDPRERSAFPVQIISHREGGEFRGGMTMREYFAARAPAEIAGWFEPKVPPEPEHPTEPLGDQPAAREKFASEDFDWRRNREIQRTAQWPWAWADAVLAAGNNPEAKT